MADIGRHARRVTGRIGVRDRLSNVHQTVQDEIDAGRKVVREVVDVVRAPITFIDDTRANLNRHFDRMQDINQRLI